MKAAPDSAASTEWEAPMRRSANHLRCSRWHSPPCVLERAMHAGAAGRERGEARSRKPLAPLRVEMQQDEGGFTIVEEARVGNDIHGDYDTAMRSSSRSSTSRASRRC